MPHDTRVWEDRFALPLLTDALTLRNRQKNLAAAVCVVHFACNCVVVQVVSDTQNEVSEQTSKPSESTKIALLYIF